MGYEIFKLKNQLLTCKCKKATIFEGYFENRIEYFTGPKLGPNRYMWTWTVLDLILYLTPQYVRYNKFLTP